MHNLLAWNLKRSSAPVLLQSECCLRRLATGAVGLPQVAMPVEYDRRKFVKLLAVVATVPAFKIAVGNIQELLIAQSGTGHVRPTASAGLSAWLGQSAAATQATDTMLVAASVASIKDHVDQAISLVHPLSSIGSRLPQDVQDAIQWVARNGQAVPVLRQERLSRLEEISHSVRHLDELLWKQGAPKHVQGMIAYKPRLAFLHALVVALKWPHTELVVNMAVGAATVGPQPDTGVWRLDPPKDECSCFEDLKAQDTSWNSALYKSIKAEALKPQNHHILWAAWKRTQEEVAAGWCTPVVGGFQELEARYGKDNIRLIRRFGIVQNDKCRCCDSATASGHNPCSSHQERLVNVRADFPMEAAAQFATHMEIDGTWTMQASTNDQVAAFRRVACADPSTTIVAQWDPRGEEQGGQCVRLFYVQGFNFGLKTAVMAFNAISEFQTRAAVRLLPVAACHYFDDWCCAEPDFTCANGQKMLESFMRLTGFDLDGVKGRDGMEVAAKKQPPSLVTKFLGVVSDFTAFAKTGKVRMYVPPARIGKVREMIKAAIQQGEISSGDASSLCGKLQFCLAWGVGRFGRAAMGPIYRHIHARRPAIGAALQMSFNFLLSALTSLKARDICVKAGGRSPPVLVWSDATGTNDGEGRPVMAFVARFPGGMQSPGGIQGVTAQHPRWVHGFTSVSDQVLGSLKRRKQQVGQLELLAAASSYFSLSQWIKHRDVIHFIDNTAAVSGITKGYSAQPDSARIIHAYHALNVRMQTQVHFEWVRSEANIADLPTRGQFDLLKEYGSKAIPFVIPPISDWTAPDQFNTVPSGIQKERGGKRGRKS